MKVKFLTIVALVACSAFAQQRRVVTIGGGRDPQATADWPKISARAASDEAVAGGLRSYLDALVQRDLFSGTILVAKNGKPLFLQSYGLADKAAGLPNTNETKYNLGSIDKTFTRIALMQLREAGKIDFEKTLRTCLPDYPSDIADKITIAQILDHSSGLGDFFGPAYRAADKKNIRTLRDYQALFVDKPLEFEPGTRRRYSNAGYVVLGLVIERLSGMNYHDYVRKNIFVPAGMRDTGSFTIDEKVPNRAIGYMRDGGERVANTNVLPGRGSSAGGGYSTAADMLRFVEALQAGKLTQKRPQGAEGWAGGMAGINAIVEYAGEWAIVVLSNYDPPAAEEVAQNVRNLLGVADEE
jgi:CubicO group peptidase (beta-lactamase class C family)